MNNNNDDYKAGYQRPPKHSQFKKGQSGNPKGRPRSSKKSFEDDLHEVLSMPIKIIENGKTKYISGRKALLKKQFNEAIKGDSRAFKALIDLDARQHRAKKAKEEFLLYEEFKRMNSMSDEELHEIIDRYNRQSGK